MAQETFEQAKILAGQAKEPCAPLPQCPFLFQVTRSSAGDSWGLWQE